MSALKTLNELSTHLGISQEEVEGLVSAGELTAARIGSRLLFTDADLDAFLKARGSKGVARRPASARTWVMPAMAMLLVASGVWAAFPGASTLEGLPVVVPYAGTVELNSAPINGTVTMSFALYDTDGTELWVSADQPVPVNAGHFSVILGTTTAIPDRLFIDNDETYLGVTIDGVPLDERQALAPTPFAMRAAYAAAADDFDVAAALTADTADVTNAFTAKSADITNTLSARNVSVTNLVTARAATITNAVTAGSAGITGLLTSGTADINGLFTAGSANITNTLSANNLTASNTLSASAVNADTADFTEGDRHGNSTSGGSKVPGSPLQFRWGTVTSDSDANETTQFSIAFPTACLGVIANRKIANTSNPFDVMSWTRTNFTINRNNSTDGDQIFTYFAYGY